jgi:drug/metabolite transporter (DMT)-like permease
LQSNAASFFGKQEKCKKMKDNKNIPGHLMALFANMLWGLMSPIGKSALAEFSALTVTTFRMVGAAACFWILSLFCKKEHVNHRDMLRLFFASIFALVCNQGVFIFGLSLTSPIDASIVTTTLPIVTMIVAALFLREPVTSMKVIGIFLGAVGALILIMSSGSAGSGGNLLGDIFCLMAQISFSIYLTVFKSLSQRYTPITLNKWMFVYASMCYIPLSYNELTSIEWSGISTAAYWQVSYVVLGGTFVAYICLMGAQQRLRPTVVSMYNYMQPIMASTVAIILGMGSFNIQKVIAVVLVFSGVYIVTQSKSRRDMLREGKKV